MANARARRNFLSKIKVNGVNLSSLAEIKEGVCSAYQALLSDPGDWRPSINGLNFKELGEGLASSLEVMFSMEEIFAALSSFCGDKAPGPDGFTMAFWLFCWDVVKPKILGLFREFYLHGTFQRSLNSTFLLLIPKKEGTEDLKDFRPISLVGSVYKLLAKVLANRLNTVMGEVISDSQHAFIHGRQILDVVLIANEALDSRLKDNIPGLLLKMDIEKAFDHVNWNFLVEVMSKMGFGHRWINWIKWCCSTASFSILINGSPSGFFRSSRGLRQDDPLSPYLFLLAMEALSQLLSRARNGDFISGFRVGGRGSEGLFVSHLLFADDTLIFCDTDADQLQYLSWTFMWFEAISGLKVNLSKTKVIPVGEGIPMETLAAVLGCKIGSLPTSYLGLPLGAPYKSTRVWDAVKERFRKRQYLFKGGRLTLLKSTLSSLPTYFLSLFVIPKRVCVRLENIQRDFLWGGGALENKPHLQIIFSKYELQEGGWCSKGVRNRYGVGVWKAIRKGWENFRSHSRFIIGDGTRVKFWKDLWRGNQSLEEACPMLFNLSVNKEGWVAEAWEEDEGGGSWGLRFNRHLNDWEVGEVESLLSKLHPLTIRRGVEDLFRWKENKNGTFSVKSFYSSFSRDAKPPFPARTIWTPWIPIRANFFVWDAAWSRLLTTDRLKRFGWSIPNSQNVMASNLLPVWGAMGDALLCEKNLLGWHGSFVGKKREKAWRAAPLCLMWTIWKERNRRAFDDMERNDQDIKSIFLYTFVNWARVYIEEHTLSLIDFVDWLATK
ncbi:LINE-1 retrotransposable element ORF2 protein [Vitis vinifera]|uniref:LINE-1 retrotransposable element ORF2 protein n=1 Tax=Vitis vinifera TaxID=29760 RepID=A0A438IIF6_VITVI|nr:LINE-1 retrotransposable element ORF2 protein [Vitis vinifera]